MNFPRASGILLHITSLPGKFGIGDLGQEAYHFADFLSCTGQKLWQILPLGPVGYGNSPYQTLSVFAGNPLLINLEKIAEDNLLDFQDLDDIPHFSSSTVDYQAAMKFKMPLLEKSFSIFERSVDKEQLSLFETFCHNNASWLDIYSLFMALKEKNGFVTWNTWKNDIRRPAPNLLENWSSRLGREIRYYKYIQFQFFQQWFQLKNYCNTKNIRIIGDVPFFAALDSAEVWSNPNIFYLDSYGKPTVVAGVPPDYFNERGQVWGNPVYRWDILRNAGYKWWVERIKFTASLVDIIRLDHFRGYEKYWEVPLGEKTALNGRWASGPGAELFETIQKKLGVLPFIAEDLGFITPEVTALRDRFNFPGMKVLQFAFGNDPLADEHKPHNYVPNCCVYTGTHDNNTTTGWFRGEASEIATQTKREMEEERQRALQYTGTDGHDIHWDFIQLALLSKADTAIIPLQDILGLGSEARMNTPGTVKNNWSWRFTFNMLTDEIKSRLKEIMDLCGR